MRNHATSTFDIDSWEPVLFDERDGVKLSRTRVTKTFHGDIEGHSTAELLMAGAQNGSAAYVGFERIEGHLHGRSGSFVLHHSATMTRDASSTSWTVVPDSGAGELRSLRGEARIVNEPDGGHTFTLDYELD
ncbi:MAG: DUF3224 domain-containing protein [Ktedonobacterales bacterium]